MPTSTGPDGIDVSGYGWTNQSTLFQSNLSLESYAAPNSDLFNQSAYNSYGAWSLIPEDAIVTNAHTSTNGWLTRVFVPTTFSCGHIDIAVTSSGSVTNAVFGLYSGSSFAVGPLAWTADVHSTITGAAGLYGLTWNGASSPSAVTLTGGNFYWVYSEITGTSPTLAGSAMASAAVANANLTASATYANNTLNIGTGPYTTLTSASTITPQTTWANSATKMWFGLRA